MQTAIVELRKAASETTRFRQKHQQHTDMRTCYPLYVQLHCTVRCMLHSTRPTVTQRVSRPRCSYFKMMGLYIIQLSGWTSVSLHTTHTSAGYQTHNRCDLMNPLNKYTYWAVNGRYDTGWVERLRHVFHSRAQGPVRRIRGSPVGVVLVQLFPVEVCHCN